MTPVPSIHTRFAVAVSTVTILRVAASSHVRFCPAQDFRRIPRQFAPYFIVILEKLSELRMIPKVSWIVRQVGVGLQLASDLRMVLQELAESTLAAERESGWIPRESDQQGRNQK